MARTSLFRQPASQPASPPASQPARIRQSNNQFFPSENLVKNTIKAENNWTLKVTSRKLTRKTVPPVEKLDSRGHVIQHIIRTNVLTKCNEDCTSSVNKENCQSNGGHVFQRTGTIYELSGNFRELTKKSSRPPPSSGHVFLTRTSLRPPSGHAFVPTATVF
ncbi:hypothetical protein DPMN_036807 [Dreissena polymorpha]|uniref:Uncharacterized protein n=1 Tax=Dreissena polymorpha TaxID=45954 RepID=A0A9D4RM80_DREPO|nr:hypothetical protein DPMN_036807 [Dreissena polymorpha]